MPQHLRALAALLLLAGGFGACSSKEDPAVVVGVSTQVRAGKDLASVRVAVRASGRVVACARFAASALPQTVSYDGAGGEAVDVEVAGYSGDAPADCGGSDGARVVRRATTSLVSGQRLFLPMPLQYSCLDVACPADQSCVQGRCVSSVVDSGHLIAYSDPLAFGDTSFCLSKAECFDGKVPALLVDPPTCTYQFVVDATVSKGLNVEVIHDDLQREVLDLDADEGFVRDATNPERFRLAPGLCDRVHAGRIIAVVGGIGCPSKTAWNPICTTDPVPDGGDPTDPPALCTSAADLPPAKSALYVLMDRSRSMRAVFGQDGLREALDLALSAPMLRNAQIAMGFLPGAAADCASTPSPFASPQVPFGAAGDVHGAIAAAVADSGQVLPSDPPLYLDGALRASGAYQALTGIDAEHRELLLLGNRGFAAACSPSVGALPALAGAAYQGPAPVRTSAILLKAPPETDQQGRDPYVDAVAITRAGVGAFFDASFDETVVAQGLASILGELGTCLYDLPPDLDVSAPRATTKVSWFDLVTSSRVDVDFDPTCNESTAATAAGWNVEGRRLRICGKPCFDMRYDFGLGAVYAVAHHAAPPDVPVKWAPACP